MALRQFAVLLAMVTFVFGMIMLIQSQQFPVQRGGKEIFEVAAASLIASLILVVLTVLSLWISKRNEIKRYRRRAPNAY